LFVSSLSSLQQHKKIFNFSFFFGRVETHTRRTPWRPKKKNKRASGDILFCLYIYRNGRRCRRRRRTRPPGSLTYPSFLGRPFFSLSIRPTPNANNKKIGGPTGEKKSQEKRPDVLLLLPLFVF
jgi:hypothetical protein